MRKKRGFALIECLAVIAMIAVLVGIIVPTVSTATVKASAAANAANLRAVQAEVQTRYLTDAAQFGSRTILLAKDETLQLGDALPVNAPSAKKVEVGAVNVPKDCAMMVRLAKNASVVATYNGYTAENFAQIAETGNADGIEVSLMDSIFDNFGDIFDDIWDNIFGGGGSGGSGDSDSSGNEEIKTIEIDLPLYVDEKALLAYMDRALEAEALGSDCATCVHQGTICPGYHSENGSYACVNCGHYQGVHSTPVLHAIADVAQKLTIESLICDDMKSAHIWNADHICTRCQEAHLVKIHLYLEGYTCAICGAIDPDIACENGFHQSFDRNTGKCTNCGSGPDMEEPCGCTDGSIGADDYCANCGHGAEYHDKNWLEAIFGGNFYGSCGYGH